MRGLLNFTETAFCVTNQNIYDDLGDFLILGTNSFLNERNKTCIDLWKENIHFLFTKLSESYESTGPRGFLNFNSSLRSSTK